MDLSGPGLLFVQSRISRHDLLDETAFMHWYDTDHIAEVVATSGIRSALRWKHIDGDAPRPYLSIYPLDDIAFLATAEFKSISVKSPLLPGTGLCYDLADFDVSYYNLEAVVDPTSRGKGHTTLLVVEQTDQPGRLPQDLPGYLRSTRFVLRESRSNEQSRQLKGLDASPVAPPQRPVHLVLHEFESGDADALAAAVEGDVFRLAKTHGEGNLFHR